MAFVAADIETGEQVVLCIGDIARAACISCVLPGVFEPVMWGNRVLVDGGILNQMPLDVVKSFGADIIIGVSVRGTKHIFTSNQMQLKKVLNTFKKFLFIDEIGSWVTALFKDEDLEHDFSKKPNLFSVLGKSMDLAIKANNNEKEMPQADLIIKLNMSKINRTEFDEETIRHYYKLGLQIAEEYIPQIRQIIAKKQKAIEVVA
jgi:predicted acylesterase/phospholipase RssA